jgi:hypothetical protein
LILDGETKSGGQRGAIGRHVFFRKEKRKGKKRPSSCLGLNVKKWSGVAGFGGCGKKVFLFPTRSKLTTKVLCEWVIKSHSIHTALLWLW